MSAPDATLGDDGRARTRPREEQTSRDGVAGVVPRLRRLATTVSPKRAVGLVREVRGLATHVALYPLGLLAAPLPTDALERPRRDTYDLPVVLVHGYFHNRSGFFFMARRLRKAGFGCVYGVNYNPMGETIESLAAKVGREVDDILRVTGAPKVHLVGHSLGGLICRWFVQEMDGEDLVDTCVTIGAPHEGTYAAYAGWGPAAAQMRPGSAFLQRIARGFGRCRTRFVNLYSDLDVLIVPPSSAVLPDGPNVENLLIRDLGHTSLLISSELVSTVAERLSASEVRTPTADVSALSERRRSSSGDELAAES